MEFKIESLKIDLGMTPFENMFLNMYVDKASGDALKFYLLVYKDIYNQGNVDLNKIQRQLDFSDEDIKKCIDYWISMGVFREKKSMNNQSYIEIVSFRQMYFGDDNENPINENSFDLSSRKQVMFENIINIINRALTPADITRIQETLEDYKQDPELVTEAFRQAKTSGNVDVKYVMGYLKTWRDQNIFTLNDLKTQEERQKLIRKNSPRQYKRSKSTNFSNDDYKSYAEKARAKRFKKMLEKDDSYEQK